MLEETVLVPVTNISSSVVGYTIPELSVTRRFIKEETKNLSVKELRALSYTPGGIVLIRDYLRVSNEELLKEFGIIPEEEYFWTIDRVKQVLLEDSADRLQDCLNYAPAGIVDLVKEFAVSLKINDMTKREIILQTTGFNVTRAIEINRLDTEDEILAEKKPVGRKVPPTSKREATKGTPTIETNYKITK